MTSKFTVTTKPAVTYKDRLFRMIFSEPEDLLSLYNAMNGSAYTDASQLVITTLENAIYLSMKNDISFMIESRMLLYEQQSSFNPNMPLRSLMYTGDLYSALTVNENIYGSRLIQIPTPEFVVLYNGLKKQPDVVELRLSDAFEVTPKSNSLELVVKMVNINEGHNQKLLKECKKLGDYAHYVALVRRYSDTMSLEDAVERAITECIENDVLAEFLRKNRAEAEKVSIYEYDAERQREFDRAEGKSEGLIEGEIKGKIEGQANSLLVVLGTLGTVQKELEERIRQENDLETLEEWLKKAVRSKTIAEFEASISANT